IAITSRAYIAEAIRQILGIICTQAELAILYAQSAYIYASSYKLSKGITKWSIDSRMISRREARVARDMLWITGVLCQRFFPLRVGSRWFKVGRGLGVAVKHSKPAVPAASKTRWFVALHENQEKQFKANACEEVSVVDEKLELNGWLYCVRWIRDLEGLNKMQL
ncbi:unnamed protein product, partial [Colletotrichum noveboracense]